MRNKVIVSAVAAIVAVPLFALISTASWFSHDSSVKFTIVSISQNTKLANGQTLEAGKYNLKIPLNAKSPELKFYQNGKLVASVPAHVKQESRKPSATEIDFTRKGDAEYLTEVRPGGSMKAYVISASGAVKSGA